MGLSISSWAIFLVALFAFSGQAHAFGAGNIASISRVEGQNWRHGDIEDTLLTLVLARVAGGRKFSKLDVQRVYFGNWLRDYSQAVDVGTLKYVSTEAIRILIWVLGFLSFGYGTNEFEVTTERLGCYEPTEHIDNPLGYAEGEDARKYDRRLRGPIDEERELSINPRTGLKNYIASENLGISTSAALVRRVFRRSIQLGREYGRSGNKEDLHEALRLLGTGLHCLEDYAAHSNYTELSLIELGESEVFPHVGRDTKIGLDGKDVYPIVTGTFGGVDFFHSVLGELSDKATQSEIQSLEGVISESENDGAPDSLLQDLLSKIPEGLIGSSSDEEADKMNDFKAQSQNAKQHNQNISPREPEEWTRYLDEVHQQILPVLEWHDNLIKSINEAIEKIPVIPDLIEQIQEQINVFVFSIIAPYVLPIIQQVKTELQTGSSEVIQSSREQQHVVFENDSCSDPTHSMLSKDHFSNVLNEPAGRVASQIVKWVVPQLMECWDNEDADIKRTLDRIVHGVFHHPALRDRGEDGADEIRQIMFGTVQQWWEDKDRDEQDTLREQLSREGVQEGKNHKEGVQDCGHGCGKPLTLHKGQARTSGRTGGPDTSKIEKIASKAAGGGALGGLVGGLVGQVGSMILNDSESRSSDNHERRSDYSGQRENYERRDNYKRHENYEQHDTYERHERPGRYEEHERHEKHERRHRRKSDDEESHNSSDDDKSGDERKASRRHRHHHKHERQDGYAQQYQSGYDGGNEYSRHESYESRSQRRDEYGSQYSEARYEYQSTPARGEYSSGGYSNEYSESRHGYQSTPARAEYGSGSRDEYSESRYGSQGASRTEYGGGSSESRYDSGYPSARGEYGRETSESGYGYGSRPTYGGEQRGYYEEGRRNEEEVPRYGDRQEGYGGYGGESRQEYEEGRYGGNSGYGEGQYGYGQRHNESRGYGY